MIQKTLLVIFAFLTLQSCKVGTFTTLKNDEIDKNEREKIKILNDKLFKAISSNDVSAAKPLLKDGADDIDTIFNRVSLSLKSFKADSYATLDEYNIHNSSAVMMHTFPSGFSSDNDYIINYKALNKEMYISLLLSNGLNNQILIIVIYGKYANEWKINHIEFGEYSLFNKAALDFYQLAKASYDKSYYIDADTYISLSKKLLRPGDVFFQYQKEKEINEFFDKIMTEVKAKYKLPLTLENIDSKPKVFKIFPEIIFEGLYTGSFPMVCYLSNINLKDTISLKAENEKVKKEVSRLFTGIDQDKKFVFYRAYNEFPDSSKKVKSYGFVDKLME